MSDIVANWRDARVNDLREWKIAELQKLADKLGVPPMDPTAPSSLAERIADHELKVVTGSVNNTYINAEFRATDEEYTKPEDAADYGVPWGDEPQDLCDCNVLPITHTARSGCGERKPNGYNIRTFSGMFIYEVVLPEFLRHFFDKNADYGDQHRTGLGLKGEFVGLHRKMAKLQKAIWDGEEMVGEGPEEMLFDLIGTALLMLDLMHRPLTDPGEPKAF